MPSFVSFALLSVLFGLQAPQGPTAREVFEKALARQGGVRPEQIADVALKFRGQITEEGTHTITREYWYRARDRSFRVRTRAEARRSSKSERGVLGRDAFWERGRSGIVTLSRGNREHRRSIETIDKDRAEFERILRLVLLTRLDTDDVRIGLASAEPVPLVDDLPFEARSILGKEREAVRYFVLRVERKDEAPFLLYVHTEDFTVRKAVLYPKERPEPPAWHYYFGPFTKNEQALGLTLPQYFSVHEGRPKDTKTRDATVKIRGELAIRLNGDLADTDFKPAE
jgi:hypothetical protein